MVAPEFEAVLSSIAGIHRQYGPVLDTALLVFFRMMGFVVTGPIFNRKNIPIVVKVVIAIYLTSTTLWLAPVSEHGSYSLGQHGWFLAQLALNVTVGAFIGFVANMILEACVTAGALMNNRIGLSSAMIFDPATNRQSMILEPLFSFITMLSFIHMGGVQWLIMALVRSFAVFPLYSVQTDITQAIGLDYLVHLSANVITIGVQLVAPVFVVTIAVDIMLGVVNRTAQQMPVFQLSMALKPAIGMAVFLLILPTFMQSLANYLNDYASIF